MCLRRRGGADSRPLRPSGEDLLRDRILDAVVRDGSVAVDRRVSRPTLDQRESADATLAALVRRAVGVLLARGGIAHVQTPRLCSDVAAKVRFLI